MGTQQVGVIAYQYDANGNVIAKTDPQGGKAFGYDALDRLTQETGPANLTWGYDANGNRLRETQGSEGRAYSYAPETNRLTQVGRKAVTLDAAGNTLTDEGGKRRYAYNQAGRLAGFLKDKQLKASYVYDYRGLRTRKIKDPEKESKTVVFHYDQAGRLIAETDARGHPERAYVYLEDRPIAQIEFGNHRKNDRVYYLHTDALGTPRLATDTSQQVVWRDRSNAFGAKIRDEHKDSGDNKDAKGNGSKEPKEPEDKDKDNEIKVNLRFAGQYYDKESGLHYNWNRYYDPKTGRYLTSDPIGLGGGLNTYAYVRNNPLAGIDPLGLCSCEYSGKQYIGGSPDFDPWFWESYSAKFYCTYNCVDDNGKPFQFTVTVERKRGWFQDPNMVLVCPHVRVYYENNYNGPPWVKQAWDIYSFDPRNSFEDEIKKKGQEYCSDCGK